TRPAAGGPAHEAIAGAARPDPSARNAQGPPPPIVERPAEDPPSPDARWVEGYWAWDPDLQDYRWTAGGWVVPPPGKIWINGFWSRDERGWSRIPGSWADRRAGSRADWRAHGPPSVHPPDEPGQAPGPDFFYVPGGYIPDGDTVVWKRGFWAKIQ